MTTVTNTKTKEVTEHASMKLAKMFIEKEIDCLNEDSKYFYTESNFKIS